LSHVDLVAAPTKHRAGGKQGWHPLERTAPNRSRPAKGGRLGRSMSATRWLSNATTIITCGSTGQSQGTGMRDDLELELFHTRLPRAVPPRAACNCVCCDKQGAPRRPGNQSRKPGRLEIERSISMSIPSAIRGRPPAPVNVRIGTRPPSFTD